MTFELYHTRHSTCSQKVRLTLAEKGLPERGTDWVEHEVDLGKFEHLTPEYLALNPNGVVPTFLHDGEIILESSAIVEYLDDIIPEQPLSPPDALGKAHMRAWLRYIEEVPTVAVRVPSFANLFAPMRFAKLQDEQFLTHADRLPLRKEFYQRMTKDGFSEKDVGNACEQIHQTCERMQQAIEETGGPWLMGEQFTLVDILVTPAIDRMDDLGYAGLWADLPRVGEWFERLRARPSYAAAFYPGARVSERYGDYFRTADELKAERGY